MIDGEVQRLRRLRRHALRTRALARALRRRDAGHAEPLFDLGACACWRLARKISGHLRSHPHLPYQQDASPSRVVWDVLTASLVVRLRSDPGGRAFGAYARQVQQLARQLSDVRALTWSADLGDALARSQAELSALLRSLHLAMRGNVSAMGSQRREPPAPAVRPSFAASSASEWPYLAL
jgi:hypothetical protein